MSLLLATDGVHGDALQNVLESRTGLNRLFVETIRTSNGRSHEYPMTEPTPAVALIYLVDRYLSVSRSARGHTPGVLVIPRTARSTDAKAPNPHHLPYRLRRPMYWALLPDPAGDDKSGFTDAHFEAMDAGHGRALYQALRDAAARA